jgi:hypothetical protein
LVVPYYNLKIIETNEILADATSANREGALGLFGDELGKPLTFKDQGGPAPYLFEEWTDGPHWINPTIPVFEEQS